MKTTEYSRIALIGANGKAGSAILSALLNSGFRVRALVRQPERLQSAHPLLEVRIGDATAPGVLEALLDGCDVVINAASNTNNPAPISSFITRSVLANLQSRQEAGSGARYFVLTGKTVPCAGDTFSAGTLMQRFILNRMFPAIMKDKRAELALLQKSGVNWTLIRCPLIVSGDPVAFRAAKNACGGKSVTAANIAEFIIHELDDREWERTAPFVYAVLK